MTRYHDNHFLERVFTPEERAALAVLQARHRRFRTPGQWSVCETAMKAIDILTEAVEAIVASGQVLLPSQLADIARLSGQIVSLAMSYELAPLVQAGRRLCALAAALSSGSHAPADPVRLHARAMRRFGPNTGAPCRSEVSRTLAELDAVLRRFGVTLQAADF